MDFSPHQSPKEIVGTAGIEYMKVTMNFKVAFPQQEAISENEGNETQKKRPSGNTDGENKVLAIIYDKGLFYTTNHYNCLSFCFYIY